MLTGTLQTNFNEIRIKILIKFYFMKMHLKILSATWCPFCSSPCEWDSREQYSRCNRRSHQSFWIMSLDQQNIPNQPYPNETWRPFCPVFITLRNVLCHSNSNENLLSFSPYPSSQITTTFCICLNIHQHSWHVDLDENNRNVCQIWISMQIL